MTLTPERIAEIEARVNAATEGPWEVDFTYVKNIDGVRIIDPYGCFPQEVEFIAHARQDIPDLLAEVMRCWAEIEKRQAIIKSLRNDLRETDREATRAARDAYAEGQWDERERSGESRWP